jgi:hypothetical protein
MKARKPRGFAAVADLKTQASVKPHRTCMSWVASVIALIDAMVGAGSMGDGVFPGSAVISNDLRAEG